MQRRLVDHLGIERLRAVIGGSLGGHMALTWATRLPERVAGAVAVATSPRLTSQALAFDVVGRNAILRDPAYHKGRYYDQDCGPTVGLAIARMLGHITYLSRESMMQKFDAERLKPRDVQTQFETKFSVGSYLAYQGDRFGERFDANSYLTLSMAIDLFDLGDTPEKLAEVLRQSSCRWLLMSFTQRLALPAVPIAGDRRRLDRRRQAGELLQRRERLRPRRLPAAEPDRHLRRADPGVLGESQGRGKRGEGRGERDGHFSAH